MDAKSKEYDRKRKRRRCVAIVLLAVSLLVIALFICIVCGIVPGIPPLTHDARTDLTNVMIAVFTIVLSYVTYLQWDVMAEQNDAVEQQLDQMRLDQRPWVGIETTRIDETQKKIDGWITWKNYGSNPAFIYANRMIAVPYNIDDKDLAELTEVHPDQPAEDFMQMVIPPGRDFSAALPSKMVIFSPTATDQPLPPDYTKEVIDGKRAYYVIGAIFYKDANNARHVTGFCLIYDSKLKQFRQYEKHNYMQ